MIFVGMYSEISIDTIYNFVIGKPLWEYHLAPIHNSYTSVYSLFIWGLYGFHLSLFHDFLVRKWKAIKIIHLAFIMSFEAVFLEIIFNGSFLLLF